MPTETEKPIDIQRAYGYLSQAVQRRGQSAQIKIAAHIRSITDGRLNNIAVYHGDSTIPDTDKLATYKLCFNVVAAKGEPDWSKLAGSHAEGAAAAPVEAPAPRKPKNPAVLPASPSRIDPLDAAFEQPPRTIDGRGKIIPTPEEVTIEADESADPLTRMIISLVRKHIKVEATAGTDEKRVEEIARGIVSEFQTDSDKGFKDKLEKHLANGSFPTSRVQEMLDKLKEELAQNMVQRIVFVNGAGEVKPLDGLMHPQVPQFAAWIMAGVPVWAWSAAGSGKTHMARQIAMLFEAARMWSAWTRRSPCPSSWAIATWPTGISWRASRIGRSRRVGCSRSTRLTQATRASSPRPMRCCPTRITCSPTTRRWRSIPSSACWRWQILVV